MEITLVNGMVASLKLLEMINEYRKEFTTKKNLAHNDLLKVIRDEFDEEISQGKISQSDYTNTRGKKYPMFNLTPSQAKQVLVRESKQVRKAVIKKLDEIEKELNERGYIIADNINNKQIEEVKEVLNLKELTNDLLEENITLKKFKEKIGDHFKNIKNIEVREKEIKKIANKIKSSDMSVELSSSTHKYLLELQEGLTISFKRSRSQKLRRANKKIDEVNQIIEDMTITYKQDYRLNNVWISNNLTDLKRIYAIKANIVKELNRVNFTIGNNRTITLSGCLHSKADFHNSYKGLIDQIQAFTGINDINFNICVDGDDITRDDNWKNHYTRIRISD